MARKAAAIVPEEDDDGSEDTTKTIDAYLDSLDGDDGLPDPVDDDDDDDGPPMTPAPGPTVGAVKPRRGRPPKVIEDIEDISPALAALPHVRGPKRVPPAAVPTSPSLQRLSASRESAYQELDTLIAGLNFASREYEIRVSRRDPRETPDGVKCDGYLGSYSDQIRVEDIRRKFGGGTFEVKVFGPHPTTGNKGIIKNETIPIGGEARMPEEHSSRHMSATRAAQDKQDAMSEMLRQQSEANDRTTERMLSLVESNKADGGMVDKLLPVLAPLIEKMMAKNDDASKALIEAQRAEREERRRDEDRRREEERRAEDRRREEEREARKIEDERRREERAELRRLEEKRLQDEREARAEQRRAEDQRRIDDREQVRRDEAERQRRHEQELSTTLERGRQEKEQMQLMMKLTQDAAANNQQMLMQSMQFQIETMTKRAETGGIDSLATQLRTLNDLRTTLTGGDIEQSTMEKVLEGGEKLITMVIPLAQQAMSRRQGALPAPQAATAAPTPNPGPKPVVIDLGPKQPAQAALPAPQAQAALPAPQAAPETSDDPVNDLTQFVFPAESDDLMQAGTLLLRNVDLAVQQGLTAEQVVAQVLTPFAASSGSANSVLGMASGLDEQQLLDFVTANTPAGWAIRSPRGEEVVSKAFELWTTAEAA